MRHPHIVNTSRLEDGEVVSTIPAEWAASSATEVDEQTYYPQPAKTVTLWMRIARWARAWQIKRMYP